MVITVDKPGDFGRRLFCSASAVLHPESSTESHHFYSPNRVGDNENGASAPPSYHLCRNRLACECARKHADSSLRLARISNFVVGPVTIRVGCSETKEILTWRPIIKYRYRTIPPTKLLDMSFYLRETHTEKFSNKILTV
jgi:hypothetical protein